MASDQQAGKRSECREPTDPDNNVPDWIVVSWGAHNCKADADDSDGEMVKPGDLRKEFRLPWTTIYECIVMAGIKKAKTYKMSDVEAAVAVYGPPGGSITKPRFILRAGVGESAFNLACKLGVIAPTCKIGRDIYFKKEDAQVLFQWWFMYREQQKNKHKEVRHRASRENKKRGKDGAFYGF